MCFESCVYGAHAQASKAFHERLEPFNEWLDTTERRVNNQDGIASTAADIQRQMDEQNALTSELAHHKADLDDVIIAGHELIKLCDADDAQAMDEQLEGFKQRYGALSTRSEQRLAQMESALPLAGNVQEAHEKLLEWLQHIEPQLRTGKELTGPEGEQQLLVRGQK